jgi:hypothetical protein
MVVVTVAITIAVAWSIRVLKLAATATAGDESPISCQYRARI